MKRTSTREKNETNKGFPRTRKDGTPKKYPPKDRDVKRESTDNKLME